MPNYLCIIVKYVGLTIRHTIRVCCINLGIDKNDSHYNNSLVDS